MPQELSHDLTTPGEAFQAAGYVTGYFGKWHLGRGPKFAPDTHGYEHAEQTLKEAGFLKHRGKKSGPKESPPVRRNWLVVALVRGRP